MTQLESSQISHITIVRTDFRYEKRPNESSKQMNAGKATTFAKVLAFAFLLVL